MGRTALLSDDLVGLAGRLRSLAVRALRRMFLPEVGLFAFRLRRSRDGSALEGVSRRYTAIALIGLAGEDEATALGVLAGRSPVEICGRLVEDIGQSCELGEVALTLRAARALRHPQASRALHCLERLEPAGSGCPTVELAWALTALTADGSEVTNPDLADSVARRLIGSFRERSSLFPHYPIGTKAQRLRGHISCFADLVYPIQALSLFARSTGCKESLHVASRCADRMCRLQGSAGQWWWHYDVRTGRVVERYPVYSVHQDAMAPMSLFALRAAGGPDHTTEIQAGMKWLLAPEESSEPLIDTEADLIWRKVARREPFKISRAVQALASRMHPALRVPGLDFVCRPGKIDYESRPYHMGWILYAWRGPLASGCLGDPFCGGQRELPDRPR